MREAERRLIILFAQSERKSDGIIDILAELLEADRAEQSTTIYELTNSNRHFHERILRQAEKTVALKAALQEVANCQGQTLLGEFCNTDNDLDRQHQIGANKAFDQCADIAATAIADLFEEHK